MPPSSDSQSGHNSQSPGLGPSHQSHNQAVSEQLSDRQKRRKGKNGSARDIGAVKHTSAQFLNELGQSPPAAGTHTIASQSPPAIPDASKATTPPLIEAISSNGVFEDDENGYRTDPWAKSVPFGKSPPKEPLQRPENEISLPIPGTTFQSQRPRNPSATPPSSPPVTKSRPVSVGNGFNSIAQARQPFVGRSHRSSTGAHHYQPPLPHMVQPHFFGAPELDLGMLRGYGASRSKETLPSFVALDDLTYPSKTGRNSNKAVLIGSEGRLDVLALDDDKARPLGCIEGLNGTVISAKLLPPSSRNDHLSHLRPLVALVIHGPEVELGEPVRSAEGGRMSDAASDHSDILPELPPNVPPTNGVFKTRQGVMSFQTRVEVHSLPAQAYVATLLVSQPAPLLPNYGGTSSTPPPPSGDLQLEASGLFLVVSSGVSGEVFIFTPAVWTPANFECLGKVWTSTQAREHRRYSNSSNSTDADSSPTDAPRSHDGAETPILSLSDRWLAIAPPMSPARSSIRAIIPQAVRSKKAVGLESHNASSPPSVTCIVDTPDEESMLNKVARGVAQEVVKGARWIGDQGLQTWNSYWNKDALSPMQGTDIRRKTLSPERQPALQYFPPTHASEALTISSGDPEFVSVIDVKQLLHSHGSKSSGMALPLVTFQPPGGCSFLSFAPNGLILLTASKKGDVQYVWDLMQLSKCRAALLLADAQEAGDPVASSLSPRVRQVARYSRLTTSSLVDVIWSVPMGEQFAVVTRNGTIHLFDLPMSAFQWPPLRRIPRVVPASTSDPSHPRSAKAENSESVSGPFASAFKLVSKTQPILANLRGRTPSVSNTFVSASGVGIASATGFRSGRAVAAGLSKSVGAATGTVQSLRHAGDNRLHIDSLARLPSTSRVTWLGSKDRYSIVLVDGESLRRFKIGRTTSTNSRTRRRSVFLDSRGTESRWPSLSHLSTLSARTQSDQIGQFENEGSIGGYWSLEPAVEGAVGSEPKAHPLSQAEIETNPPYQPFHSDRRVNLFIYPTNSQSAVSQPDGSDVWVFGNDIPATRLSIRSNRQDDDEGLDGNSLLHSAALGAIENRITVGATGTHGENALEEIVITSRRRKTGFASASTPGIVDDDGFFEDDCEVLDFAGDRV